MATRAMLDRKSKELDDKIVSELGSMAKYQQMGIDDPSAEERIKKLVDDLKGIVRQRINIAQKEEDFAKAADDIAKIQQINPGGDDREVDELLGLLSDRYSEKFKWVEEAAKERPQSIVNLRRRMDVAAKEQALGSEGLVDTSLLPRKLTDTERTVIERRAKAMAQENVPKGWVLVSAKVDITDRTEYGNLLVTRIPNVTIEATYREDMGVRGIPRVWSDAWSVTSEELLEEQKQTRRPVESIKG
jgi:hypothetical protein